MHGIDRAAIALALSLLAAASATAAAPRVTTYCLTDPLEAGPGGPPLGDFVMKARLTVTGSHYVLEAWNVMPDNPQVLSFKADGTYQPNGPTRIRFIDSFDNHGRGVFTATGAVLKIDIDQVTATPAGQNIGRNYGTYTLHSRGCRWG